MQQTVECDWLMMIVYFMGTFFILIITTCGCGESPKCLSLNMWKSKPGVEREGADLPRLTCGGQKRTHASSSPLSLSPSLCPPPFAPYILPLASHPHYTPLSPLISQLPHFSVSPQQQPHPGSSALRTRSSPPLPPSYGAEVQKPL